MAQEDVITALAFAVAGVMIIQGIWLSFLTYSLWRTKNAKRREREALEVLEKDTVVEDMFLLHRSGLLLKHYTRRLRPNVDSDLLSGMLVAVQEFVKDTFREEHGNLNEIKFGELRVVVAEGKWTILAGVVRGQRVVDIMPQLKAALQDLESKHEDLLLDWDGTMDNLPEVDRIMQDLVAGKYRDRPMPEEGGPQLVKVSSKG